MVQGAAAGGMPEVETLIAGPRKWLTSTDAWTERTVRKGSGLVSSTGRGRVCGPGRGVTNSGCHVLGLLEAVPAFGPVGPCGPAVPVLRW